MLAPDTRSLYVEAIRPPIGYKFDEAIATTYSLDLTTLLTVPLSLALPHLDLRRLGKQSAVTLLDAVRRVAGRVTVYADRGKIAAPSKAHLLYGLLEPVIVEARAPQGGSLHAKMWLLRFVPEDPGREQRPMMRLFVTSRNLTPDRSWDVAVQLDGEIRGRNVALNRPIADLVAGLPDLATHAASAAARAQALRLAEDVRRVEWEHPPGFDALAFHVIGLTRKPWLPESSRRLLVISPFVGSKALQDLAATTAEPVAVVSRGEELDKVTPDALSRYAQAFTLHGATESEDGEEQTATSPSGLHAKVFMTKQGRGAGTTHVYVGSANATDGALLGAVNLEILVELSGKPSRVGGIDAFLATDGFGPLLVAYAPPAEPSVPDPLEVAAERALEAARLTLLEAPLGVEFRMSPGGLQPSLALPAPVSAPAGVATARAWLVSTDPSTALPVDGLWLNGVAALAPCASASATGLVAFELTALGADRRLTFTLNLPATGIPSDRDDQIVRVVVDNQDRFLQYLRALLDGIDGEPMPPGEPGVSDEANGAGVRAGRLQAGLLEQLVRTKARAPDRLEDIRRLVDALRRTPEGDAIIPGEFKGIWSAVAEEVSP